MWANKHEMNDLLKLKSSSFHYAFVMSCQVSETGLICPLDYKHKGKGMLCGSHQLQLVGSNIA